MKENWRTFGFWMAAWVLIGVLNFGATMAYFAHRYSYVADGTVRIFDQKPDAHVTWRKHLPIATFLGVAGPFGIPAVWFCGDPFSDGFAYTPRQVSRIMEGADK